MATTEIPREQWAPWLDAFGKRHEGWIVELQIIGRRLGDQQESGRLPLVGIGADVKDREARIEVSLGGTADAHLTHVIDEVKRVWLRQSEHPAHEAVAVEGNDGTMTIVRFRGVPPDAVDLQLPRS